MAIAAAVVTAQTLHRQCLLPLGKRLRWKMKSSRLLFILCVVSLSDTEAKPVSFSSSRCFVHYHIGLIPPYIWFLEASMEKCVASELSIKASLFGFIWGYESGVNCWCCPSGSLWGSRCWLKTDRYKTENKPSPTSFFFFFLSFLFLLNWNSLIKLLNWP